MNNGWIETPEDFKDLPWDVKAGKRLLWWIEIEAIDHCPAASFAMIGSFVETVKGVVAVIKDKENDGGGYYYPVAKAYKPMVKGPYDD